MDKLKTEYKGISLFGIGARCGKNFRWYTVSSYISVLLSFNSPRQNT